MYRVVLLVEMWKSETTEVREGAKLRKTMSVGERARASERE